MEVINLSTKTLTQQIDVSREDITWLTTEILDGSKELETILTEAQYDLKNRRDPKAVMEALNDQIAYCFSLAEAAATLGRNLHAIRRNEENK